MQNKSGTHAATWWHNLAADLSFSLYLNSGQKKNSVEGAGSWENINFTVIISVQVWITVFKQRNSES